MSIFFKDVSGSGIDTGTINVGAFSIDVTVPAGLLAAVHFERAGVTENFPVLIELNSSSLGQNRLVWYVAFIPGNGPVFELDAADPGQLIGYLNLTVHPGTAGSLLEFTVNTSVTFVQDEVGIITNSVENGKLTADFGSVQILFDAVCYEDMDAWPDFSNILDILDQPNLCFPE